MAIQLEGKKLAIFWICVLAGLSGIGLFVTWQNDQDRKRLLQSPAFTIGRINELKRSGKSSLSANYTFFINGQWYNGSSGRPRAEVLGQEIFRHTFPVIYNSKDWTQNDILIFEDDFAEYGLAFPDSLSWVSRVMDR